MRSFSLTPEWLGALIIGFALTGGAGAGYWAGSRAAASDSEPDTQVQAELARLEGRLAALERGPDLLPPAEAMTGEEGEAVDAPIAELEGLPEGGPADVARVEPRPGRGGRGGVVFAAGLESIERLRSSTDPSERRKLALELVESPFPPARFEAIRALLELDPRDGIDAVRELVEGSASDPRSRRMAAEAISLLGDVDDRSVDRDLYEFAKSGNENIRRAAVRTLETRGDTAPVRAVIETQRPGLGSPDAGERTRTLRSIGNMRSPTAASVIIPLLSDSDSGVRIQAAQSLSRSGGGATSIAALQPLLSDPIPAVRDAGVRAVQRLTSPQEPDFEPGFAVLRGENAVRVVP